MDCVTYMLRSSSPAEDQQHATGMILFKSYLINNITIDLYSEIILNYDLSIYRYTSHILYYNRSALLRVTSRSERVTFLRNTRRQIHAVFILIFN